MEFLQTLIAFFSSYGYEAVFGVLLLCGFGLPIPEDITLVAGGVISGLEYTNVHVMFAVSMAGVMVGDSILFALGRWLGTPILNSKLGGKILTPARYASVQQQFEKYGNWVVFFGRFMPGLRAGVFFVSGLSRKISFLRFFLLDGFAALISVPVWVYLGYYLAHELDTLLAWVREGQMGILMVLAVVGMVAFAFYLKRRKKNETLTAPVIAQDVPPAVLPATLNNAHHNEIENARRVNRN